MLFVVFVASVAAAVGVEVVDIDMAAAGAAFPHISRVRKIYLPLSRLSVLSCKYIHTYIHKQENGDLKKIKMFFISFKHTNACMQTHTYILCMFVYAMRLYSFIVSLHFRLQNCQRRWHETLLFIYSKTIFMHTILLRTLSFCCALTAAACTIVIIVFALVAIDAA